MDMIADMLTVIRNAGHAGHEKVDVPKSTVKLALTKILKDEGYIKNFKEIKGGKQDILRLILKYDDNGRHAIVTIERVSKPSLRRYVGRHDVPRIRKGLGVAILSTSQGIMTDRQARQAQTGGEVMCHIW